eukprot:PhM_4_TR11052/c0_g1_i1/m.35415
MRRLLLSNNYVPASLCCYMMPRRGFSIPSLPTAAVSSETVKLDDGRTYIGQFSSTPAARHPLPGTVLTDDGDTYTGEYNAQWQRCGRGESWHSDGSYCKGTFDKDELVDGEVWFSSGSGSGDQLSHFKGKLRDGAFQHGMLHSPPTTTYTGAFKPDGSNVPHGKGKLELGGGRYLEGTFADGALQGYGTMRLENGFLYRGEFEKGVIQSGELRTPEYVYEGDFNAAGRPHGTGRSEQLASSMRLVFEGWWEDGKMVSGTCRDENGAPIDYIDRPDMNVGPK